MSKISEFHSKKTHCKNGHALTDENIKKLSNSSGHRVCKICHRYNAAKARERNRKEKITPIQRFWTKVTKTDTCWIWTGCKSGGKNGDYGVFGIGMKQIYAHRFSYEHFKNAIDDKQQIDHLCRNRACVNPDHLEAVTQKENLLRGNTIPSENAKKTHCKRGHSFSENSFNSKLGYRRCKICIKNYMADYWKTHKKISQ